MKIFSAIIAFFGASLTLVAAAPIPSHRETLHGTNEVLVANRELRPLDRAVLSPRRRSSFRSRAIAFRGLRKRVYTKSRFQKKTVEDDSDDSSGGDSASDADGDLSGPDSGDVDESGDDDDGNDETGDEDHPKSVHRHGGQSLKNARPQHIEHGDHDASDTDSDDDPGTDNESSNENGTDDDDDEA